MHISNFRRAALATACLLITVHAVGANEPPELKLRSNTVDLTVQPSALANTQTTLPRRAIIRLDGPLTAERKQALANLGVTLGAYVPKHAYITDLSKVDGDALSKLGFVSWAGQYRDEWKLCPSIAGDKSFESIERSNLQADDKKRVVLHLFKVDDSKTTVAALTDLGATVVDQYEGEYGQRLTIDIDSKLVGSLCSIDAIRFIEEAPEGAPRNSSTSWIMQSNIPNVYSIWDRGLHGEGQFVGLIDWDLDEIHCAFFDNAGFGPAHRKIEAYAGFNQNTLFGFHGTHTGGVLCGEPTNTEASPDLYGIAYASRLVFQDQSATITAINLGTRLQFAHDAGVRVHSNSWGSNFDNSYNAWAADIDAFSFNNEDDLVMVAIINGNQFTSLLSPENAKNCLAVGAAGDAGSQQLLGSGAKGPTPDGRQKPEVWATGCTSRSANIGTSCGVIQQSCATSWAAPAVTGLAALTRQYFTDGFYPSGTATFEDELIPSGALLKAMLINSAVDMSGFAGYFGEHEGWGRILLEDALYFDGDARKLLVQDVRHANGLQTNDVFTYDFEVQSNTLPLKITLSYHDAPAAVGAAFAPVNDLDLVVTAPSGATYLGNNFVGTETVEGGTADSLNNSEQVHRLAPETGLWRVEVVGTEVNVGPQGFAIVVTGDVAEEVTNTTVDLAVTATPEDRLTAVGTFVSLSTEVTNMGTGPAEDVTLDLSLPTGLTLQRTRREISCTIADQAASCDIGTLAPGESYVLDRLILVNQPGIFEVVATTGTSSEDAELSNNQTIAIIRTLPLFDCAITDISGPDELLENQSAEYQIHIRNNGPDASIETTMVVSALNGLQFLPGSACATNSDGTLSCIIPPLAVGEETTLTLTVSASKPTSSRAEISVAIDPVESDGALENNNAIRVVAIRADSDSDGVDDDADLCAGSDDSVDADQDGTPDGCDSCPNDPAKTEASICGCGQVETDSDGDGIPDCGDGCPNDAAKLEPGDCGCGVFDEDANGNGVADCFDSEPMPPSDDETDEMTGPVENPLEADPPIPFGFRLEDLDPCLVRYLLQSFLGIPMCGPCISFAALGSYAGIANLRRRRRARMRTNRIKRRSQKVD